MTIDINGLLLSLSNDLACPVCGRYDCLFAGIDVQDFSWAVPVAPFSLADLGLTDEEIESLGLDDEAEAEEDSELARVIGEVRVGNYLIPSEGETLLQALVDEEQAHAETLADLGDAEDEIAELKDALDFKTWLLDEAGEALVLAANTIQSAEGLIDAQRRYISFLEAQVADLEATNRARAIFASVFFI